MNTRDLTKLTIMFALAGVVAVGCMDRQPDVIVSPPSSTTIVHDRAPNAPNPPIVVVNPPAPSRTDTHTDTTTTPPPDTGDSQTTTTNTTTKTSGGG